jgi:hypothetical protein
MATMDKKPSSEMEPLLDIDVIRMETYATVALDGEVKSSFNMKNYSIKYYKQYQYAIVVGKKQTVIIPMSNIAFMQI